MLGQPFIFHFDVRNGKSALVPRIPKMTPQNPGRFQDELIIVRAVYNVIKET